MLRVGTFDGVLLQQFSFESLIGFMLVDKWKQKLQNLQYFKKAISGLKKIIFSCDFLTLRRQQIMEVIYKIWSQTSVVCIVHNPWVGLDDGGIAVDLLAETRYLLFLQCLKCLLGPPNRLFNGWRRLFPRGHSDGWCETAHSPQLYLHHFISK